MDDQHDTRASENGAEFENGVHDLLPASEKVVTVERNNDASSCSLENDELCASFDDSVKFNDMNEVDSSVPDFTEVSLTQAEGNSIASSNELGEKESTGQNSGKPLKVVTKAKSGKLRSPKDAAEAGLKKIRDGKSVISTSGSSNGGMLPSESRPTRPFESRTKSFNQRHAADGSSKRVGAANVDHPKQVGQPASTSSTRNVAQNQNDSHMEKTKPKVLKKSSSNNTAGMAQSIVTDGADKPSRVGALPAYGYSFRCNERAEKRKEFYSKLEEKIQAKEEEKSSVQAKTKALLSFMSRSLCAYIFSCICRVRLLSFYSIFEQETQEAEMRMLRKSLTFKATPLPNFYQEPAPQKVELKKIAPTRPKSPKLGRKKSTLPSVSEENRDANTRAIRSSLDEKSSQQNNLPNDSSSTVNAKKPLRKSLPKLPSQKTNLPNERRKLSDQKASVSKETSDNTHQQKNSSEETSGAADDVQKKQEAETDTASIHAQAVVEFQAETTLVEEPTMASLA